MTEVGEDVLEATVITKEAEAGAVLTGSESPNGVCVSKDS